MQWIVNKSLQYMGSVPGAVLIISDLCKSSLIGEVINICHDELWSDWLPSLLSLSLRSQLGWVCLRWRKLTKWAMLLEHVCLSHSVQLPLCFSGEPRECGHMNVCQFDLLLTHYVINDHWKGSDIGFHKFYVMKAGRTSKKAKCWLGNQRGEWEWQ